MARRRRLIPVELINDYDEENWVSRTIQRTERRNDILDLRGTAESIVILEDEDYERLPIEGDLRKACDDARVLNRDGARKRLIRHIADLLVDADLVQIGHVLSGGGMLSKRRQHAQTWRGRILAGGTPVIEKFLEQHPAAERQRVRLLTRQAKGEGKKAEKGQAALDTYLMEFYEA